MQTHLCKLLEKLDYQVLQGEIERQVTGVFYDSRKVIKDSLFVCIVGAVTDGHKYASDVVEKGAGVLIVEHEVEAPKNCTVIQVADARKALAYISAAYFEYPAKKMKMVGITGTKGKTTVTHMIRMIFEHAGIPVGIIGTIGAYIDGDILPTNHTTPESYQLHELFYKMVEAGVKVLVMEVSSQAFKLERTAGIQFDYGVFLNITPDHIGPAEHADFSEYLACKLQMFSQCNVGIANQDCGYINEIMNAATCPILTFGEKDGADYQAKDIHHVKEKGSLAMEFTVAGKYSGTIVEGLPGRFNVQNANAAMAVCHELSIEEKFIEAGLKHVCVKGRVEPVPVSEEFTVLIDYAHNGISTESVLTTLREYAPTRLVSVFGCGGNRAKMRRYSMGEAVGKYSDFAIVTEDNSRDEAVSDIIADIEVGLKKTKGNYITIPNRREAIEYSIQNAKQGDMIVILGKGHEEYQETHGVKTHFSDREEILKAAEKYLTK